MVVLGLLLVIWGAFAWVKGEQWKSLVALLTLITAGYNLKFLSPVFSGVFSGPNLSLLLGGLILLLEYKNNEHVFSINKDKIALFVWLLIIYAFISFIVTLIFEIDLPDEAFKTFREGIFPIYYFIFRQVRPHQYEKFFKVAFKISIVWAVVFFLQPLGIHLLGGIAADDGRGASRYYNYPDLSLIFFLWAITVKTTLPKRIILILIFGLPMLMMQGRALMLALLFLPIYFYFKGYASRMVSLVIVGFAAFILFAPYIASRFNMDEIAKEVSSSFSIDANSSNNEVDNNFAFRTAIVAERIKYLVDNNYLLTGIGSMNEDSPVTQKRFNFKFCSIRMYQGNVWRQQIVCGDVAFLNQIIKYGILYIVLFITFYILIYRKLNNMHTHCGDIGAAFVLILFLVSPAGNWFNIINTLILFALLSYEENRTRFQSFQYRWCSDLVVRHNEHSN